MFNVLFTNFAYMITFTSEIMDEEFMKNNIYYKSKRKY